MYLMFWNILIMSLNIVKVDRFANASVCKQGPQGGPGLPGIKGDMGPIGQAGPVGNETTALP